MQNLRKSDSFQKIKNESKKLPNDKNLVSLRSGTLPDVPSLISDFLKKKNLNKTLEIFKEEYQALNQNDSMISETLAAFDQGRCEDFFKLYEAFQRRQPSKMPTQELDKLEFYLQVYFVVYSIHPFRKNQKEISKTALNHFKIYLEEKGAELAKFNDLIQYFALPYIKNLKEHASFKQLFTQSWLNKLREDLSHQLKTFGTLQSNSELEMLLVSSKPDNNLTFNKTSDDEIGKLKEMVRLRSREIEELKLNYKKLENESKVTMKDIHRNWATFSR